MVPEQTGSSQPLNTTISFFRRVRCLRDNPRYVPIKWLTTATFDPSVVAVPGEETETLEYRDVLGTVTVGRTDAFPYGHAITVLPRHTPKTKDVLALVPGVRLVPLVGNPRELQLESVNPADDLYGEVQAALPLVPNAPAAPAAGEPPAIPDEYDGPSL